MALSPSAWYRIYDGRSQAWELSPLEDQQLAGAIMWMPSCLVYAVIAAVQFGIWLRGMEAESRLTIRECQKISNSRFPAVNKSLFPGQRLKHSPKADKR